MPRCVRAALRCCADKWSVCPTLHPHPQCAREASEPVECTVHARRVVRLRRRCVCWWRRAPTPTSTRAMSTRTRWLRSASCGITRCVLACAAERCLWCVVPTWLRARGCVCIIAPRAPCARTAVWCCRCAPCGGPSLRFLCMQDSLAGLLQCKADVRSSGCRFVRWVGCSVASCAVPVLPFCRARRFRSARACPNASPRSRCCPMQPRAARCAACDCCSNTRCACVATSPRGGARDRTLAAGSQRVLERRQPRAHVRG